MDERLRYLSRIFLLVLVPFSLGAFIFPHTQYISGDILDSPMESKDVQEISYSFSHSSSDIMVPSRVNAIFPLAGYLDFPPFVIHSNPELCFKDNDSYLILAGGTKYDPEFSWIVYYNNKTTLIVQPDGENCSAAYVDRANDYEWVADMALPKNDSRFIGNLTFVPRTLTYPRITMDYGLLQGLIMIPVCYLFIWYPAVGIWKKIRKGIHEQ